MTEHKARLVVFAGTAPTEDASHALMVFNDDGGEEFTLAMDSDQAESVGLSLLAVAETCLRQKSGDKNLRRVHGIEWWEFLHADEETFALSFRKSEGIQMAFRIHRDQIPHMIEVLQTMQKGEATSPHPPPGTLLS